MTDFVRGLWKRPDDKELLRRAEDRWENEGGAPPAYTDGDDDTSGSAGGR